MSCCCMRGSRIFSNLVTYVSMCIQIVCCIFIPIELPVEFEVLIEYFSKIVDVIHAGALSGHFVEKNIISPADQLEIFKVTSPNNAAGILLTKISFALKAGKSKTFYQFLDITEQHGNIDSLQLIDDIRKKVFELKSKGNEPHVCNLNIRKM